MAKNIDITIIADERTNHGNLVARHAWAVWIETDSRCVLFDVGQSNEVVLNARQLGVDLEKCDTIVLSHGHYDHTGGLPHAISMAPNATVYAHPFIFNEKHALNDDGTSRNNGMPRLCEQLLRKNSTHLIEATGPTDLGSGLWLTGEIPRRIQFEDVGGEYFIDEQCQISDPIRDDQSLFFESSSGIVVVLGCAHAGVINTIEYIRELTGNKEIYAIIGGMHLIHASKEKIESTVQALQSINPNLIGSAHCTGRVATDSLKASFGNKCKEFCVGTRISLKEITC